MTRKGAKTNLSLSLSLEIDSLEEFEEASSRFRSGRGGRENGGKPWRLAVVGGNSLQSTRSAFNNALPRTPGDLEREPITVEWNRMVFGPLSSP